MSIADRISNHVSHVSNVLGKGPGAHLGSHGKAWPDNHQGVHGGGGQRGFPSPGSVERAVTGTLQSVGLGNGPTSFGIDRPISGHWNESKGNGADRPSGGQGNPGYGVDRPSGHNINQGNQGNQGADRPNGNNGYNGHNGNHGVDRPNGNTVQHGNPGADRPNATPVAPGQVVREVVAVPRQVMAQPAVQPQPGHQAQGTLHATQATAHAMAATAAHPAQMAGQALAAQGHASQQAAPAQHGMQQAAMAARADAVPGQQRADGMAQPRAADPGMVALQRAAASAMPPAANIAANATAATTAAAAVAANTAAGHTMATPPAAQAAQVAESRNPGNPLVVNDRATVASRPDAAGTYTGEGPQRRRLERAVRALPGGLSSLLTALGAQGHTGASGRSAEAIERELREATMQRLFWVLAIVAYGCVAFALIGLLPTGSPGSGGGLVGNRSWTGGFSLIGLLAGAGAWWFARGLSRGGERQDPPGGDRQP